MDGAAGQTGDATTNGGENVRESIPSLRKMKRVLAKIAKENNLELDVTGNKGYYIQIDGVDRWVNGYHDVCVELHAPTGKMFNGEVTSYVCEIDITWEDENFDNILHQAYYDIWGMVVAEDDATLLCVLEDDPEYLADMKRVEA